MAPALRKPLMAVLGLGVGALCLWLSARGVDWREAVRIFRNADVGFIVFGIVCYGAGMTLRVGRWQRILAFRAEVRWLTVGRALLGGYAINGILPARLGELFRADYLARLSGLSRSGILASIFADRLLDLLAAIILLAIGLAVIGGGHEATRSILIAATAVAVLAGGGLLLLASRLSRLNAEQALMRLLSSLPFGGAVARLLGPRMGDFAELLRVMRTRRFATAALVTAPIWAIETTAVWAMCRAVHVDLGASAMLCVIGASSLSTLLPTAPGFVGSYQFAFVLVLAEFGFGATQAIAAGTTSQVYIIGFYTLVGLLSLAISGGLAWLRYGGGRSAKS